MAGKFKDKVALVTGAGAGTGRSIVERLSADGAHVVCTDINEATLAELKAASPEIETKVLDVTRESEVEALVHHAVSRFGHIDMAFNVVGGARVGYLLDLSIEDWQASVDLSLTSVFLCLKHEGRHMMKRGHGSIVNIASLNAHVPSHAASAYTASKAGVEMLTKNAALEYTPGGVRVNAVLPGLIKTPRTERFFEDVSVHDAFMAKIPMGRAASPDEIAAAALFLASDEASYISGSSLLADGGWELTAYPDLRFALGEPSWLAKEQ